MLYYNKYVLSKETPRSVKRKEQEYGHLSEKLWNQFEPDTYAELRPIIEELNIPEQKAYRIVRTWAMLGMAHVVDRSYRSKHYQGKTYDIRILKPESQLASKRLLRKTPRVCYSIRKGNEQQFKEQWQKAITNEY